MEMRNRDWKVPLPQSEKVETMPTIDTSNELAEVTQDLVKTTTQGMADLDFKATILRLFEEPVEDG
jgi:hypothetical protein